MIHEVGVELEAHLKTKGCPFEVIDGPEKRGTTSFSRERVVIEHDPNGDGFGSRQIADKNPRTILTRNIGVKITIYAKSNSGGATYWEHIRRVEHVLDLVLVGVYTVAKKRQNLCVFKSGKLVEPDDLKESETPGGAAYELLLTFDRGVADRKWNGDAQPTATIASGTIKSTTTAGDAAGDTETACGAI